MDRAFWEEHLDDGCRGGSSTPTRTSTTRFRLERRRRRCAGNTGSTRSASRSAPPSPSGVTRSCFPDASSLACVSGMPESGLRHRGAATPVAGRVCAPRLAQPGRAPAAMDVPAVAEELEPAASHRRQAVLLALIGHDPASRDKHLEAEHLRFPAAPPLESLDQRAPGSRSTCPKPSAWATRQNIARNPRASPPLPQHHLVIAHLGRCYTLPHAQRSPAAIGRRRRLVLRQFRRAESRVPPLGPRTPRPRPDRLRYRQPDLLHARPPAICRPRPTQPHQRPFLFNQEREPPEVEARYTLYMYEELAAFCWACEQLGLDRAAVEAIFHGDAQRLLDAALTS